MSGRQFVRLQILLLLLGCLLAACSRTEETIATTHLALTSSSFSDVIPEKCSGCKGQGNVSPELSWSAPPEHTQSFVLIVYDRDSLLGSNFAHWSLYDMPSERRELTEGVAKQEQLPDGSRQGVNDNDQIGYFGPCPPRGTHHYVFTIYALDTKLNLPPGVRRKQVLKAMKGHILASGELIGRFGH